MAPSDRPMPTTTLSRAMRRLRRAMTSASPSRSRRSTVSTTSAASDEAVAPRAPTATPTSASAERGRVVDAVTDHDRVARPLLEPDCFDLLGRGPFGEDVIDADDGADGPGVLLPVAGHHDDAAYAVAAQLADRACGIRTDRVVEEQRTDGRAVDVDEDRAAPRRARRGGGRCASRSTRTPREVQPALPTATRWPSTRPRTPWPGTSSTSSGNDKARPRARAARTTAAARTWGETWSRLAA